MGYSPWGCKESDKIEYALTLFLNTGLCAPGVWLVRSSPRHSLSGGALGVPLRRDSESVLVLGAVSWSTRPVS